MILNCQYHVYRIIVSDISIKTIDARFALHFCRRMFIFNHFYAMRPKAVEFGEKNAKWATSPFKVIQGHRCWYQSNAHLIYGFLLVINTNLLPILHCFRNTALKMSKIAIFGYPLAFNPLPPDVGFP